MKRIVAIATMWLAFIVVDTQAQISTVSHTITINIQKSASLRLKPSTIIADNFNVNSAALMEDGIENEIAGVYQVRSNDQWIVQVSTAQSTWNYQGNSDNPQMPSSLLQVKSNLENNYLPISQTGNTLARGNAGDFGADNEFAVDYKIQTGLEYPAGIYRADVSFTVSNP